MKEYSNQRLYSETNRKLKIIAAMLDMAVIEFVEKMANETLEQLEQLQYEKRREDKARENSG